MKGDNITAEELNSGFNACSNREYCKSLLNKIILLEKMLQVAKQIHGISIEPNDIELLENN